MHVRVVNNQCQIWCVRPHKHACGKFFETIVTLLIGCLFKTQQKMPGIVVVVCLQVSGARAKLAINYKRSRNMGMVLPPANSEHLQV